MSDQDDNPQNDGSPHNIDPTVNQDKPASSVPNPFAKPAAAGVPNPFAKPAGAVPNPFAQPHVPSTPPATELPPVFGQKPAAASEEFPTSSFGSKPTPSAPVEAADETAPEEEAAPAQTSQFQFAPRSYDAPSSAPAAEEPAYVQEPTLSGSDFAPRSYDAPAPAAEEPAYVQEPTLSDSDFAPRSYDAPQVPAAEEPAYVEAPTLSDADFAPRAPQQPASTPEPEPVYTAAPQPEAEPVYTPSPQPEPEPASLQSYSAVQTPQFSSSDDEEDELSSAAPASMEAPIGVNLAGDRLKDLRKELAAQNNDADAPKRSKKGALVGGLLILLALVGGAGYFLLGGDDASDVNNAAAPAQIAQPQPDADAGVIPPGDNPIPAPADQAPVAGSLESLCDADITAADNVNGQCTINAQTVPCDVYSRYQESGFFDFCAVTARNGSQGEALRLRQAAQQQQQATELQQSANAKKTAWDLCGQTITKFDKQGETCLMNDVEVPCQHYDYYQAHPTTPFYCGEKK